MNFLTSIRPERSDFRLHRAYFRPKRAEYKPGRVDLWSKRADFGPNPWPKIRTDFGPEKVDFGSERANFGPERVDLGLLGLISGLKEPYLSLRSLGGYGQMDVRTDVRKFTPVSYRTSALWGRCPKRKKKRKTLAEVKTRF